MSGFPDVGYTTVAHYTLSGELYTFPSCPRGFPPGETPSETKPSAVLCCNRHISLDSFRHALHTKENFSPVHFGCVLLAENRHYTYEYQGVTMGQRAMISVFVFTSSTNFMGVFCSRFSFVFIALPL